MKTLLLALALVLPLSAQSDSLARVGAFVGGKRNQTGVAALSEGDRLAYLRSASQTLPFRARYMDQPGMKETTAKFSELCAALGRDHVEREGKVIARPDASAATISGTILQRLSGRKFLLSQPDCVVVTARSHDWVDGDQISSIRAAYDGIEEFAAVTGAKRSVRRYVEIGQEGRALEPTAVLMSLREGATFKIQESSRQTCPICIGKGKIRGDGRKGEDESKLKTCPLGADGKADFTATFVLSW